MPSICNFPLICQWMTFLRLPFITVIHTTYLLADQYLPTLKISMDWRSLIHRNVWLRSTAKRCWTLHCSWTTVLTCCWTNKAVQQCSSEIKYASSSIGIRVIFFFLRMPYSYKYRFKLCCYITYLRALTVLLLQCWHQKWVWEGTTVPVQVMEQRYSRTHSLPRQLDWGEWSTSCPCRFSFSGYREVMPVPTQWKAGWAPEPISAEIRI